MFYGHTWLDLPPSSWYYSQPTDEQKTKMENVRKSHRMDDDVYQAVIARILEHNGVKPDRRNSRGAFALVISFYEYAPVSGIEKLISTCELELRGQDSLF